MNDNNEQAIALRPVNPELLIAQAIDKGVSVDTMERLLAMRRELKAEAAKEAFDRALAAFQADCPTIQKTKAVTINDSVRYRYAPLEDVVSQVKALLQQHGFSYTLDAQVETGWVTATCELTHALGHSKQSSFKVPIEAGAKMGEAQKFASALTFAKRYSFVNSLGIMTSDEDDDSRASQTNHPHVAPRSTPKDAPKANPAPKQATPAKTSDVLPKEATKKTRDWFLAEMANSGVDEAELLKFAIESGVLLDTEVLLDWPLEKVPTSRQAAAEVIKQFAAWQKKQIQGDPELTEAFWNIICPIPRKGMKRDEYLKQPDTIRSLYLAAKDGIQDAGKRLFGFANNWKPEPRTHNGKTYQPSEADHAFRAALDLFLSWREANGDQLGEQMREAINEDAPY